MSQWNLDIPDITDKTERTYLAQNGSNKGDLSAFVNEAVCQAIFRNTVKELKENNTDCDQQALMNLIDEAVVWSLGSS